MNIFPVIIIAMAIVFIGHLIVTHIKHLNYKRFKENHKRVLEENRILSEKLMAGHKIRDVGKARST